MKTIRHNIFESNSSSTHSVSICGVGSTQLSTVLKDDGSLDPNGLKSQCYGEIEVLQAITPAEKLSYILGNIAEYNSYEAEENSISDQTILDLVESAGFKLGIPIHEIKAGYPREEEYGDPIFDIEPLQEGNITEVLNIITDNSKMILYTVNPY